MRVRDSRTRTGAKDPWGSETESRARRHFEGHRRPGTQRPGVLRWETSAKDRGKRVSAWGMTGIVSTCALGRQARSDMLALKPYWGKPTVRNFREGDGNVGIIRSPLRAITLPDIRAVGHDFRCACGPGVPAIGRRTPVPREMLWLGSIGQRGMACAPRNRRVCGILSVRRRVACGVPASRCPRFRFAHTIPRRPCQGSAGLYVWSKTVVTAKLEYPCRSAAKAEDVTTKPVLRRTYSHALPEQTPPAYPLTRTSTPPPRASSEAFL